MTTLQTAVIALHQLFTPERTFTSGSAAIWEPNDADPHFVLKQDLIRSAILILRAGDAALNGNLWTLDPAATGFDFDAVERELSSDADGPNFLRLVSRYTDVARLLQETH